MNKLSFNYHLTINSIWVIITTEQELYQCNSEYKHMLFRKVKMNKNLITLKNNTCWSNKQKKSPPVSCRWGNY